MQALLGKVRTVFFEPLPEIGKPMASMLRQAGFGTLAHVQTIEALSAALAERELDVMVMDLDVQRDAQLALVSDARFARRGFDPFITIIATESVTTLGHAREYIAVGFDHVLAKPYSPKLLIDRVLDPARRPRRFVISPGYVGPERRGRQRGGGRESVLEVPDRLTALAEGRAFDEDAYDRLIRDWRARLSRGLSMDPSC